MKHENKISHGQADVNHQRLYTHIIKAKADWQNTFDSISDMICILDKEARITRVNRSFRNRLKKPYESIIGAHCYEIMHESLSRPEMCPLNAVLETRQPTRQEAHIQMGDALFGVTIYPFLDSGGEIQGTVHIYRDITEQKVLKDRLIQSEKMAAIGALAAEIAHEINNPLDYISNYIYLLSESLPLDFENKGYLKKIESGIDNLAALTRDLLEFSRPQTEEFAPLDIHNIMEGALEFSNKSLRENTIEVIRDYGCRGLRVMGSARMLNQVFLNLIHNSLDAMPKRGKIIVSTSCRNEQFVLEFTDSGIGIPEATLPRIFDPFFTTKKSSDKRGTGLGLAICYNIINQHKGEIQVSSKAGEGTTFKIIFPVAA